MNTLIPNSFYRVSVKALITDELGRIVLFEEANGFYDLPGGGLDFGEDYKEGLAREIWEESRLKVTNIANEPMFFCTFLNPKKVYLANVVYRAELPNLDYFPSEECANIRLFTPEEILEYQSVMFANVVLLAKHLLKDA
jgi:8-oxo-dGTP diphosphatase